MLADSSLTQSDSKNEWQPLQNCHVVKSAKAPEPVQHHLSIFLSKIEGPLIAIYLELRDKLEQRGAYVV